MPRLRDQLEDAVGPIRPRYDRDVVRERASRARSRRRIVRAAVASGVVVLVVLAGLIIGGVFPPNQHDRLAGQPESVFDVETDTVLVLDDGYDGMIFLDLDERIAVRRVVEGQRAGDPPYRLTRTGNTLVVGFDEIYAVPLDGSGSRKIADSQLMAPAAERNSVWLWDYNDDRVRQIDTNGRTIREPATIEGRDSMLIGIPDGVAYETKNGIALWDAETKREFGRLGEARDIILDARGERLAWCETVGSCHTLHISTVAGGAVEDFERIAPGTSRGFERVRFSPDARTLAAITGGADGGPESLVLIDSRNGRIKTVTNDLPQTGSIEWHPSGDLLFTTGWSWEQRRTEVGMYDMRTERWRTATTSLPFGGATSGIAVDRDEVERFLHAKRTAMEDCPQPEIQPSGRKGACSFEF